MLDAYLERIGYEGDRNLDSETLAKIHRGHVLEIPYENLEITLGRENRLDEDTFANKLVADRRGGWCYEMNGLLTLAYRELGFAVTRVGGAVARDVLGDASFGNHMVGLVDLDRRYVVDVGLGDGPTLPFPLEERAWSEGKLEFRLERLEDGYWRFHNHEHGLAHLFDFSEEPRSLDWYQPMCTTLQTESWSPFVQFALASRRTPDGFVAMRDTTVIEVANGDRKQCEIAEPAEYRATLARVLGRDLGDEVDRLWRIVEARAAQRAKEAQPAR
jgi:N-hydroxyarylamine O-acetyltransferase